jgi:hypothetical protein
MKKIILPVAVACLFFALMAAKPTRHHDAPEKLKAVLTDFFNSINTHDTAKLRSTTTADFMLYEDGRLWNIDSAFMNIKRHLPFSVKYQMSNLKFFVDDESGDVTYTNHADFSFAQGNASIDWIESATFRKINGEWKINFLQATVRK